MYSTNYNQVILVDTNDNEIGVMEKLEAHEKGLLHRAFSIFVFNENKELLLQRRALNKYHSAGLWTNTCCSHQAPGETNLIAGNRRLKEEMGMSCELMPVFHFVYKADLENNLTEYELDHVMIGFSNSQPVINTEEVCDYKWITIEDLIYDLKEHPEHYTVWFNLIFEQHLHQLNTIIEHESLQTRNF
jgi:isopentenyl-diphosphate delta-isomerase